MRNIKTIYKIVLSLFICISIILVCSEIIAPFNRHSKLSRSNLEPPAGQQITLYGPKFDFRAKWLDPFSTSYAPTLEKSLAYGYKMKNGIEFEGFKKAKKWKSNICVYSEIHNIALSQIENDIYRKTEIKIHEDCNNPNLMIIKIGSLKEISNKIFCFASFSCHDFYNYLDLMRNGISLKVAKIGYEYLGLPELTQSNFNGRVVLFAPDRRDGVEGFVLLSRDTRSIEEAWCFISPLLSSSDYKRLIGECVVRSLGLLGGDINLVDFNSDGSIGMRADVLYQINKIYDGSKE